MEYFNQLGYYYKNALKNIHRHYKIRLELLSDYESVIGEITRDLSVTAQGQININKQQLLRRSCSLTLINVENKYLPSENSVIWYNRKFKLWIGVIYNDDIYWWSMGVFITTSAVDSRHNINIEAVDKGGILNGETNQNILETQYIIKSGSKISDLIKNTLGLNFNSAMPVSVQNIGHGGNISIDSVPPLIDLRFNKIFTQVDISVDSGNSIGELLINTADSYGSDIYYDTEGRLIFKSAPDNSKSDGYRYIAHSWDFNDSGSFYSDSQIQYSFGGYNTVTVFTDTSFDEKSGLENVSYTAYNNNPLSPMRTNLVGLRRKDSQAIKYTEKSKSEMKKRCREYADYLLLRESMLGMNISFKCPVIPHLDVDNTIGVTDINRNFDNETFIIQSITIPLSADYMNIKAVNINWLPNNLNIEGWGSTIG